MLADRLREVLSAERLEALLRDTCGAVPAGVRRDALCDYLRRRREGVAALAAVLPAPEDEPELVGLLAAAWLELRCEWERYNNVANYQLYHSGRDAEPEVTAAAATMSGMLVWVEEVVPASAVDLMSAAAVDLLDRIRADVLERASAAGA
jgi:hypothetical protein